MTQEQFDPKNVMNNPEVREMILNRLSPSEREELVNGKTSSSAVMYKLNKVKNEVLSELFPDRYFDPSDLNEMN
ncbi:hypothetical protein ASG31_17635 [Chryseobacterium sp. Leaf404]|uniref:hypothetical protein n=1 Tax=unclassified Chryseobacterium TaxID=2593645 RepID=UPI0006FA461D|nr:MULTISPECIES: hypothetical protein [unclassified Chryseobacterium]KQT20251.1 hypothetical protein ASG31_17635 [Chryseobacterium sp. Leaf404]